ncbi:hypothetical protein JCM3765_001207 [Sporobolomyces pararoseus]
MSDNSASAARANTSTSTNTTQIGLYYGFDHWPEAQRYEAPVEWKPPGLFFRADRLPPLLGISDSTLAERAVLHETALPGLVQQQTRNGTHSRGVESYEMLELRGDALIHEAVTDSLFSTGVAMTPGLFSDVRKMLLNNATLAHLSVAYGLPSRLLYFAPTPLAREQSVAAHLYKAHIGALIIDPEVGREPSLDWLTRVFALDIFDTLVGVAARLDAQRMGARIHRRLGLPISHPPAAAWECEDCNPGNSSESKLVEVVYSAFNQIKGWHAKLYVNGVFKSCGRADTKREAASNAAFNHVCRV